MAAIPFQPMMESRPIREIAYEVLKHAIITGEIPAGERIVETEYAQGGDIIRRRFLDNCGQNRILRVIEGQDQYITRFSSMAISQENRLLQAHEEHYKLVDYIEQRDLEHFQKLMHRHIERSKEKCLEALKTQRYLQKM